MFVSLEVTVMVISVSIYRALLVAIDGLFINYFVIWVFYKVSHKSKCAHAFPSLMFHSMSLVNPDSRLLIIKQGLLWYNLALRVLFTVGMTGKTCFLSCC